MVSSTVLRSPEGSVGCRNGETATLPGEDPLQRAGPAAGSAGSSPDEFGRVKWMYPALRQDEQQAKPSNSDLSVPQGRG